MSSLDNVRKEAKRWLAALRAGDSAAHERLRRAYPAAPAVAGLRHVQHALARERGHENWTALKAVLAQRSAGQPIELTALLGAADQGETARVIEILDRHPELVNRRGLLTGHNGLRTALHFGVGHEPVVRVLLDRGADPNIRDEGDNAMPLHYAVEAGSMPIVRMLLERGADPIGAGDDHELEVIGWATCFGIGGADIVSYLIDRGAVHNIWSAIAVGDVDAIRTVVEQSPEVLTRRMDATNHRRGPLHLAVVKKQPDALQALLNLGADTEATDAAGLTALDQAALSGEAAMTALLSARGAAVRLPAAIALQREADVERLLRDDPDALQPGKRWAGLIVRASEHGSAAMIETLIRHGASVDVRDDPDTSVDRTQGYTALHAAAFNGNADAAQVLLKHGADPTVREQKYLATPAGWANYAGHAAVRDLILNGPIDLFEAISLDRIDRIPDILERDPDALNRPFRAYAPFHDGSDDSEPQPDATPLDWAIARQKPDAVRELTARGAASRTRSKTPDPAVTDAERLQLVADFLQFACWDHHVHGTSDHRMYAHAALRLLKQHPWIARDSIYTAVVCGDLAEVERILAERPEAAGQSGGARGWEPLLYLAYTRFPHQPSIDNAVAIARALLARGANPNGFYLAGDSSYTVLVGVAGQGEQDSPRQPQSEALFRLLLEHGAAPFDIQVLYNTHFNCDMIWWLDLVYAYTVEHGQKALWDDPDWTMLDMGGYGPGAFFILNAAIERNAIDVAAWALAHGANPNQPVSSHAKFKPKLTLYDSAVIRGATEIADLLARHGAASGSGPLDDEQAYLAACFRLDRAAVRAHLATHPEYLASTTAFFTAASRDRADVVDMLLDVGVPIEIEDEKKQRALHAAAGANAVRAAKLLIGRGAFIDPHDGVYDSTPLGFALHFWHEAMMALLRPVSRDIWRLTFIGDVDRVRELLREEPSLAKGVASDGTTLLWWLPEDETRALELVSLLLAHGADPSVRLENGRTAADWARKAGMPEVARRLAVDRAQDPPAAEGDALVQSFGGQDTEPSSSIVLEPPLEPVDCSARMIRPLEMRLDLPVRLHDGVRTTTAGVWAMLAASLAGDLDRVASLVDACPSLVRCDYNYMPPLHLAVREGHLDLVRYLAARGAVNARHVTYPYKETLPTLALDRGYFEIARVLEEHQRSADAARSDDESGEITFVHHPQRHRFEVLVHANALAAVESLLKARPDLALDEFASNAEGILSGPANRRQRQMLELLLSYGARVPDISKWGHAYYFKHADVAAFLLKNGMNPNHMNCHHTTLLHDMAWLGDRQKAQLLLEHGALIDAVDEEFRSTPLGVAARFGHLDVARLLIERGADVNKAGAPWATPLAWARRKGHSRVEALLRAAGAS